MGVSLTSRLQDISFEELYSILLSYEVRLEQQATVEALLLWGKSGFETLSVGWMQGEMILEEVRTQTKGMVTLLKTGKLQQLKRKG